MEKRKEEEKGEMKLIEYCTVPTNYEYFFIARTLGYLIIALLFVAIFFILKTELIIPSFIVAKTIY